MSDFSCPFCGSDKLMIEKAGGVMRLKKKFEWGEDQYEKQKDFCCRKQAQNKAYLDAKYDPTLGDVPDLDDISKL